LRALRQERDAHETRLDTARAAAHEGRAREAALVALRAAALTAGGAAASDWLAAQGLAEAPRLLDLLRVTPGWETAAETALAEALTAVITSDFATHAARAEGAGLTLFDAAADADGSTDADSLLAQCEAPWPLASLLAPFRLAADRAAALAARATLAPWQRIVTRDGTLVGRDWLRTAGVAQSGALTHARELDTVRSDNAAREAELATLYAAREALETRHQAAERAREEARAHTQVLERERAALAAELSGTRARLTHAQARHAALEAERSELIARAAAARAEYESRQERLHAALAASEALAAARTECAAVREAGRQTLAAAQDAERRWREEAQRLEIEVRTHEAARIELSAALERTQAQQQTHAERRAALLAELEEQAAPTVAAEERLRECLDAQSAAAAARDAARARLEQCDAHNQTLERARQQAQQASADAQAAVAARQLEYQELLVRQRALEEQLGEQYRALPAIWERLAAQPDDRPLGARIAAGQQQLEAVAKRLERLGNVNLAALEEFEERAAELRTLEAQRADIQAALDTLAAAIRKIDRETRSRFKETFERVDQGLQKLFPRLFGGGQAALALTEHDLLETGVTIVARPPGKRNASIQLLSGGEKALTAVALVFAIFELNPAPFCLLDEVDAPLDEANVGRFCALLRAMSERVQFIFVTHNKVTMAAADQLIGVTMNEPGVSRLVTVDVAEAARLAALV